MKFNRLCSMALAAVIAVGVMAPGITAFADGNSTTVTLTVAEPENVYTMTIPAATTMDAAGAATALANGLNVKGTNMTKNVVVTMTGADEWKMTAEGKTTTIGYAVYESVSSETALTEVEFDKTAIMDTTGSTKALYVKPAAADLAAAEPGTYTGTITFTATLKANAPAKVTVMGAEIVAEDGQSWETIANNNPGIVQITDIGFVNLYTADGTYLGTLCNDGGRMVKSDHLFSSSNTYIFD